MSDTASEDRSSPQPAAAADLVQTFRWPSVGLPEPRSWPQSLRSIVDVMLHSPVPMVLLWGPEGVMIYNDAYSSFAGGRHPRLFGSKVLEGWPEVADFNRRVMSEGLAGRTLSFHDQELVLYRHGAPEDVFMDLNYSPVFDESGRPAGVLAVVVETTERVRLARRLAEEKEAVAALNQRLRTERDQLRDLFQRAPGFIAVLRGPEHVFEMANEAYLALVGHRDLHGRAIRDALPELEGQGFLSLLDKVFASGEPYVGLGMRARLRRSAAAEPQERYVDFVFQPTRSDDGAVDGIFVEGHDVTERHRAFAAVAESEQRFRLIADSAPVPMWVSELGGRRRFVNRAYMDFLGVGFEQALEFDWRSVLHPEDGARIWAESQAGEASLTPFSLEARYQRGDGEWRWLHSISQPRWGPDGAHAGFVGVAYDVTEARRASERQALLINELNHRVKNSLASVQSLAAQSFRQSDDLKAAQSRFEGRLLALAKAHDVLTRRNWEGAELGEVIDEALRPFRDPSPARFDVGGPPVSLTPAAALAISMVVHELATNALKYGALSVESGRVELHWTVADGPPGLLRLLWREAGGPAVTAPTRRGFGTRLIERQVAHELDGRAAFEFRAEGLLCSIEARLSPLAEIA